MNQDTPPSPKVTPQSIRDYVAREWPGFIRDSVCLDVGESHAVVERSIKEIDIRPGGVISGPTQFAVADSALWFAIMGALGFSGAATVTSEMSIRFVRPATGQSLSGRADILSLGSRSFVGSVVLWTHDFERPVAIAQGTYVMPREGL